MKTSVRVVAAFCLLSVGLIACSPVAPTGASMSPAVVASADSVGTELVAEACDDTTWSGCVKTMHAALELMAGKLIVVCEYPDGHGGVEAIEHEQDAEGACDAASWSSETPPPGASSVAPGRVVTVVQLP